MEDTRVKSSKLNRSYLFTYTWWQHTTAWLDWGLSGWLTTLLQCFDTVGWVIRPVNNIMSQMTYIYCVEWDASILLNCQLFDTVINMFIGCRPLYWPSHCECLQPVLTQVSPWQTERVSAVSDSASRPCQSHVTCITHAHCATSQLHHIVHLTSCNITVCTNKTVPCTLRTCLGLHCINDWRLVTSDNQWALFTGCLKVRYELHQCKPSAIQHDKCYHQQHWHHFNQHNSTQALSHTRKNTMSCLHQRHDSCEKLSNIHSFINHQ